MGILYSINISPLKLIIFFILNTHLTDISLKLCGRFTERSLLGVEGSRNNDGYGSKNSTLLNYVTQWAMELTLNFKSQTCACAFFSFFEWIVERVSTFSGTKGMLTRRVMLWGTLNKFQFQHFLYFQTYQTTYSNAFDICLKQSWMLNACRTNVEPLKPVRTQLFTTSNFIGSLCFLWSGSFVSFASFFAFIVF